jgi:membrane protease YdiL (CAAX protease family)
LGKKDGFFVFARARIENNGKKNQRIGLTGGNMAGIYFLICFVLITAGSLTNGFNTGQYFVLPIGVIAILFQKYVHKEKIRELGFRGCSFKHAGFAIMIPALIFLFILVLDGLLGLVKIQPLSDIKNPFDGQIGLGLGELILVIIASALFTFIGSFISEELGFRGYLMRRFAAFGDFRAILLSSLLFGLWHIPPSLILLGSGWARTAIYAVNIFLFGLMLGCLFSVSKSLIPSSLCHGIWNALEYSLFGYGNTQALFAGNSRVLFDPEEGLIGTAVLLVGGIVFLGKMQDIRLLKIGGLGGHRHR